MKENTTKIFGIVLTVVYGLFVLWIYAAAPKGLDELPSKARQTIEKATTTAQVITNTYEIDREKFDAGLKSFRADNFVAARDSFEKADPEKRDAQTQFYIAYSFYRQGFGKVSNDDALFRQGSEQVKRVITLDRDFKSDDPNLVMKTPAELQNEFEEGLQITADDFNPLRLFRERK